MTFSSKPDVVIVGSGASGAMAAAALVEAGVRVTMLDYGNDHAAAREGIPDRPFLDLRRTDEHQADYFIGRNLEGVPRGDVKVGAQLTPPRQFINERADELLPYESTNFHPMQSLCLGGLAAGWGAACFTYSVDELRRIGIDPGGLGEHYSRVAREIGISSSGGGDCDPFGWQRVEGALPPLPLDDNATALLAAYDRRKERLNAGSLFCGRIPLAVLSRDYAGRSANPLHDMDFYSDSRRSVYRPRYTVEELRRKPNFSYLDRTLVCRFEEKGEGVDVHVLQAGEPRVISCRRLVLCAGALNTARIALNSLGGNGARTAMLCSPYTYIPCLHLRMLGRPASDRRHSLAQLEVMFRESEDPFGEVSIQMYSYRSLLLFKLVKEMPFPAWAGLLVARAFLNAFAIFGAFFPDAQGDGKWIELPKAERDRVPLIRMNYQTSTGEDRRRKEQEGRISRRLMRLGCLPIGRIYPGPGSSIHYAGTIPFRNPHSDSLFTNPDYTLSNARRVYVGDSSSWNWLPAKGLTFTMMANARRIAGLAAESL